MRTKKQVKIAVVGMGDKVISHPCEAWDSPEAALNAALSVGRPTHAAFVNAWIPPKGAKPAKVEGTCIEPPEGAIHVQLAVVVDGEGKVVSLPCGAWPSPEWAMEVAHRSVGRPTHAAFVSAWIPPLPPVPVAEVEGTYSHS